MAIDTALKRGSAINVASPWRGFLPFPDAAISQADRQTIPFMYSGIAAGGFVPPATSIFEWIIRARRRGRR